MLSKRVIACLDVRDGKLAKSVKFVDTKDIGDPIEKARAYYEDGLDELVFYDITASSDKRAIMLDVVERVAAQVFIPFSVGGGVRSVEDATKLRLAGAEKINVNTAAVSDPELITRISDAIGAQSTILSMDVLAVERPAVEVPQHRVTKRDRRWRGGPAEVGEMLLDVVACRVQNVAAEPASERHETAVVVVDGLLRATSRPQRSRPGASELFGTRNSVRACRAYALS